MGSSNAEVMLMVVAVVTCVLALVFVGVYYLDKSTGRNAR